VIQRQRRKHDSCGLRYYRNYSETIGRDIIMTRETWEMWADDYQDYWEAKGNYAEEFEQDDIDAWKEEEQKVIDELIQRMQGAYNDV
tara:strand:- start:710 stop:970 length:261 start_codon:yes stop_codon:yes gene_type:complete